MTASQQPWIAQGYHTFAFEGPQGLRVERLARQVGKNKSSFYHHFADLEIFTTELLSYHMAQAHIMAEKEAACSQQKELIEVIVAHKIDLLFNRQLQIHRENAAFAACFTQTNQLTGQAIMGVWMHILELGDNSYLAGLVLRLSLENFYLQITDETLNPEWLSQYFSNLRAMVRAFKQTGSVSALDGSV